MAEALLLIAVVCAVVGFGIGWIGGVAEGRARERRFNSAGGVQPSAAPSVATAAMLEAGERAFKAVIGRWGNVFHDGVLCEGLHRAYAAMHVAGVTPTRKVCASPCMEGMREPNGKWTGPCSCYPAAGMKGPDHG